MGPRRVPRPAVSSGADKAAQGSPHPRKPVVSASPTAPMKSSTTAALPHAIPQTKKRKSSVAVADDTCAPSTSETHHASASNNKKSSAAMTTVAPTSPTSRKATGGARKRTSLEGSSDAGLLPRLARRSPAQTSTPTTATTGHTPHSTTDAAAGTRRKLRSRSESVQSEAFPSTEETSSGTVSCARGTTSAPPEGLTSSGGVIFVATKNTVGAVEVPSEAAGTDAPAQGAASSSLAASPCPLCPSSSPSPLPDPPSAPPAVLPIYPSAKGILQPRDPSGATVRTSPVRVNITGATHPQDRTRTKHSSSSKKVAKAHRDDEDGEDDDEDDEDDEDEDDSSESSGDDDEDGDEESSDSSEEDEDDEEEEDEDDEDDGDEGSSEDDESSAAKPDGVELGHKETASTAKTLCRAEKKSATAKAARVEKLKGISKARKRLLLQARTMVKISREGDLNVKVMHVCPYQTLFPDFIAELMTRFDFKKESDFDVFCMDANGDRVDIDLDDDFEELLEPYRAFLATLDDAALAKTQSRHIVGTATSAVGCQRITSMTSMPTQFTSTPTISDSPAADKGGENPLAPALSLAHPPETDGSIPGLPSIALSEPLESSTLTLIRLYVRESYTYKKQSQQYLLGLSHVSQADVMMNSRTMLSMTTGASEAGLGRSAQSPGALLGMLSDTPDSISLQFADTQRSALGKTFTFNEREELHWSKLRTLGKGSFGTVYEGMTADGRTMAVKVQEIPLDEDAEESKALQKEINLMRTLKHKNIVAYYGCQTKVQDSGATEMEIFMELCHGGSLSSLRRKFEKANERFSISLVRAYTRQILEGLDYLHASAVMHRDIKSDNVLISATGEAKLADFGCSKRLTTTATVGAVGATGEHVQSASRGAGAALYQTMVGSPLFMAPEVMLDDGSGYSYSADVWSVGCLVLELLGRPPWKTGNSNNVFQLMYQIARATGMPTGIPTHCPSALLEFFKRCFERDAKKRATAKELLAHPWITCPDNRLEEVPQEPDA